MTTDYRALVKRRRTEAKATTATHQYCLDLDLAFLIEEKKAERAHLVAPLELQKEELIKEGEGRQAKPSTAAIDAEIAKVSADLDAEIASLIEKAKDVTVTLKFQSVPESMYSILAAQADDDNPASVRVFLNALVQSGWVGAFKDGEQVDLGDFSDVWDSLTFGETDVIRTKVFASNLRVVDIPF